MIIQEQGDHLILIRQTDHAVLSGYFARESGNENFARPEPFESFQLATAEHDNGWNEWELQPHIDPVTFLPYSFMSLPTAEHMDLYQRGIERVVKVDRYAGLLVSMHCAGLYDKTRATMPGFSAKYVKAQEAPLVTDFLQRLRLQQLRLKVDLRGDSATKDFADEKWLQANAQRLEALDRLSSISALGRWNPPPSTPFLPTTKALKWIGICSRRKATAPRWSRTLSAATRSKSAFWRGAFRSGVTPMILSCRKCWPKRPISGGNTRCAPEAQGRAPESLKSERAYWRPRVSNVVTSLVLRMRRAFDAFRDAQDD